MLDPIYSWIPRLPDDFWEVVKGVVADDIQLTDDEAKRIGLRGLTKEEMPRRKEVLSKLYLLLPIIGIILLLMSGMSVIRAALWSIVFTVVVSALKKETRIGFKGIIDALVDGARSALGIAAATAAAAASRTTVRMVPSTGLTTAA